MKFLHSSFKYYLQYEIWGFHGSDYEEGHLLEWYAVWLL
jgi:hypothetical protein